MSSQYRLTTKEIDYILKYVASWLYDSDTELKILRTKLIRLEWDPLFELNHSYENDISKQMYGHQPIFQDPSPLFLQAYDKIHRTIITTDSHLDLE